MDRFLLSGGEKEKTWKLELGSCGEKRKRTLTKMPAREKGNFELGVPTWNLEVPEKDI